MSFKYTITKDRYIVGIIYTNEEAEDSQFEVYLETSIAESLRDEYGNYKYELTENNKIVTRIILLSAEQKTKKTLLKRKDLYVETDALYMEAIYDEDEVKMQEWRDAVAKIKTDHPLEEE